jgi:hypothetical protein
VNFGGPEWDPFGNIRRVVATVFAAYATIGRATGSPLVQGRTADRRTTMDPKEPADRSDIRRELGDLDDLTVDRILTLGPRVADLVEVRVRLTQDDDVEEERRAPSPVVARVLAVVRDTLWRVEEDPEEFQTPLP